MFFLLSVFVIILFYVLFTRNFSYWSKRNVKHDKPVPLFGNHHDIIFGKKSITVKLQEIYNRYPNEKVIGYYSGNSPELVIKDPDLVRQVMSVDFDYFHPRGLGRNPDIEPMLLNLFHVDGDRWRMLRQRLTAAFTTGKLKSMFPLVINCAEKLQTAAETLTTLEEYDCRELMARFTTEFIGACGFGIEMDSINDENSQFRILGRLMFTPTLRQILYVALNSVFPEIAKYMYVGRKDTETIITNIFVQIMEQRNGKPIGRNDFIDLLLDLSSKGQLEGLSFEKRNPDGSPATVTMPMDVKTMAAQIFVFFAAGFETSSSATSFCLHQLAYNPDVQLKVQNEIDEVLSRYDNKLSYEAISEMTYLDMAFKESLRMFPSLGVLNRVCSKQYTFPELNMTIDKGIKIMIPIQSIQNDPKYYDNPTEFRPERFHPNEVKNRHKFLYLPFGEGPRACIGARLGLMQSLAGLAAFLHKFSVEPSKSSRKQLDVNPKAHVVQTVLRGIPLKIRSRKNKVM